MWPFKKQQPVQEEIVKPFTTIICIPGNWNSWDEFMLSIFASTQGEYMAVVNVLINAKKQRHYAIKFCEKDSRMKESFYYAGKVTGVTEDFLNEIDNHKHVVYISGDTGNLLDAENIALAAEAILTAGGIGIKIETAGKAFEKATWYKLLRDFEEPRLYEMFVIDSITDERGTVFSCGMQNLGFKDTIIAGEDFQQAVDLIRLFAYYQIVDKPIIKNNQTFGASIESPLYRITEELSPPYKDDDQFGNPFGMWRLARE